MPNSLALFSPLLAAIKVPAMLGGSALPDPLPSWAEGPTKQRILSFVKAVTTPGKDYFVPQERIAVFDNDGTLWCEQPVYFQFVFALDRIKALAPQHPEWKTEQPFAAVLSGDNKALLASGKKGLAQVIAVSHVGMTTDQFAAVVKDWLATARHPKFDRPYTALVYQPMLELLAYLRANDFKTFIVSAGGIEFMRGFAEETYGIPPEQVVGSSGVTEFKLSADGKPEIVKKLRSSSSMRVRASRSASTASSAVAPSSPSATRMATNRCWNGRRLETGQGLPASCTTRMPTVNMLMTGIRTLASSTRRSRKRGSRAGQSST